MGAQELTLWAGGNWGFGQDRQERKGDYKLKIIVDIVGRNILNWIERVRDRESGHYVLSCDRLSHL